MQFVIKRPGRKDIQSFLFDSDTAFHPLNIRDSSKTTFNLLYFPSINIYNQMGEYRKMRKFKPELKIKFSLKDPRWKTCLVPQVIFNKSQRLTVDTWSEN